MTEYDAHCHQSDGDYKHRQQYLTRRLIAGFHIFPSKILGTDDGTACCQRRKHLNNQHVDGIHQRNRRNSCTSHVADHHTVHGSHQGVQQLFHHQRYQQYLQIVVGKEQLTLINFLFLFFQLNLTFSPSFGRKLSKINISNVSRAVCNSASLFIVHAAVFTPNSFRHIRKPRIWRSL